MSIVMEKLHTDHKNIASLLRLLQQQVDQLKAGEFTDFPLMADIMHYFVHYPELHHHRYEELIFDILKQKNAADPDTIRQICDEHVQMAKVSDELHREAQQLQGNAVFSRDELVKQFNDYIEMYYTHMRVEENDLLSHATTALSEQEWKNINTEVKLDDDPLYGSILNKQYENLYHSIMALNQNA